MPTDVTPIGRGAFLRRAGGVLAVAFVDRSGFARLAHSHHGAGLEHPEPREGITSEKVLSVEALEKFKKKEKMLACFESARAYPQFFDGVACACSCGAKHGTHRSLLSCYETLQPTGCGACQEEGELVGKLAKEGKTLAEIRAAVDKWAD
jgi:hypothetical protein